MGVPKRLTDMQMKFAEFLVFGGPEGPMTQTEAALAAGYSPKRARQEGSELTNPRRSKSRKGSRTIHRQKNNKNWEIRRYVRTRIRSKVKTD